MLYNEDGYEMVAGILDYRQHAEHWRVGGVGDEPLLHVKQIVRTGDAEGVICVMTNPKQVGILYEVGIPFVTTSAALPEMDLPRVTNDYRAIGRMGGEHLLERGFARYGYIGLEGVWSSEQALAGFREVVEQEAGRPCHVIATPWVLSPQKSAELDAWLEDLPKPIGIMGFVDHLGRAAINASARLGLRVPDDVAVLGVGNRRWVTQLAEPPMSSIQTDDRLIGYRAAKALDGMMAGEAPPPPQWIPPIGVITRRSTDVAVAADAVVSHALQYIRDHCLGQVTVDDVLAEVEISRRSLEKRMKAAVGYSPQVAINRARIERAKQLLVGSDMTIGEVSRACAFPHQKGFTVMFKRLAGMTPGQYRLQRGR